MSDIPDWAKERARELVNARCVMDTYPTGSVAPHNPAIYAFAQYIAEHEEPPVDPLLIEAQNLALEWYSDPYLHHDPLRAAIKRGMELAREGGAK